MFSRRKSSDLPLAMIVDMLDKLDKRIARLERRGELDHRGLNSALATLGRAVREEEAKRETV